MSDRLFVDPELWFCKNPKLAFPGIQIGNDVFSGTKVYWGNGLIGLVLQYTTNRRRGLTKNVLMN